MELNSTLAKQLTTLNFLVFGQAGAGKTSLIKTLPKPVILSAESGLISLSDVDIPYITIKSMADLKQAYQYVAQSDFQSIAIDSISEVAEVVLESEKNQTGKDGKPKNLMQAYGSMADQMVAIIRAFRDLPKHCYMSAKVEKDQDEMGKMLYSPSMPGKKTSQNIPYLFDEVLALRVEKDQNGQTFRALQCQPDGLWLAKDRSGKLDAWEAPDLGAIIDKIIGGK